MFAVFCFWPLRFLLRSFRFSSRARWLSRCRACVAVAELFAAAAAGHTLRCCFLALLSCPPPLVLVIVMLFMFVLFFSAGDSTATVTPLQSGRSPHGGRQPLSAMTGQVLCIVAAPELYAMLSNCMLS